MGDRILYSFPFFAAAILIFVIALFALRRVRVRGGWYLSGVCLSATVWAICEGMLYLGFDVDIKMRITQVQYFGIAPLPPCALLFGLAIFDLESRIARRVRWFFFMVAAAIVLLVWTNPLHRLFFADYYPITTGPFQMLGLNHGPLWGGVIVYHYFLIAFLTLILLRQVVTASGYHRSQAGVILAAVAFVWLANAVYVTGKSPVPNMDISPIAFVLVAGAMAWGFFRYRLLDILPIAKTEIFKRLDDIIIVIDEQGRILDVNPAAESIFTVKASQVIGREAADAFVDHPQFAQTIGEGMASSEIGLQIDDQERVYDLRVSPITDAHERNVGRIITLRDITDRVQAEKELREREKRLRDQNRVIVALSKTKMEEKGDLTAALRKITEAAAPTLNVERVSVWLFADNYAKMACIELYEIGKGMHSAGMELLSENFPHYFEALKEERIIAAHDARTDPRTKAFTDFYLHPLGITSMLDSPIRISGRTEGVVCNEHVGPVRRWTMDEQIFSASIADLVSLTIEAFERKKSEEERKELAVQLQRAEKMESIGTLAGGVAHDLNNILSGIQSYPELLLMDIPDESPLRKPILTIKKSGEKASAIVQDLLTLARRGVSVAEALNLNSIVSDYLESPEFKKLVSFHPGIKLETSLAPDLLNIMGSPVHLFKTVMNLVSNAAEAMSHGGDIRIGSRNQYIDRPIKGYDQVKEGDYAVLSVADTGTGIEPDDMEKIFEPFYSKKVMGRSGTGLGMAVVWGTVKDHNGYIDLQSRENQGTTFELYFPVTREERRVDREGFTVDDYTGAGEAILVVDDVAEQREIATSMLKKLGYAPTAVDSGEKALAFMQENRVDLVVLDMIMGPGMDGLDTYTRIVENHPGQKAIIASGYSETDRVKKAQQLGAGDYIKKPYTLEKIGIAVRNELRK